MRKWTAVQVICVVAALLGAVVPAVGAETVFEAWRSRASQFGEASSLSVNPTDSSCWVADARYNRVLHLSASGAKLSQSSVTEPRCVSVNSSDGSCWVGGRGRVVHLSESGTVLWRSASGGFDQPVSVSVNSSDGSCWVADSAYDTGKVTHLSATGERLWQSGSTTSVKAVCVSANPLDGSCWVAYQSVGAAGYVTHLSSAGTQLWRSPSSLVGYEGSPALCVDPTDGSCWIASDDPGEQGHMVHVSSTGGALWAAPSPWGGRLASVSVNTTDGSCWVTGTSGTRTHFSPAGDILLEISSFAPSWHSVVSVDPVDGSCWVSENDRYHRDGRVLHLSSDGTQLWASKAPAFLPTILATNSTDGSCWVSDSTHRQLAHVSSTGAELWRSSASMDCFSLSVDQVDGSVWVNDRLSHQIVHLSAAGVELWRSAPDAYSYLSRLCVNQADGSCWVSDSYFHRVVHLSSAGAELWRSADGAFTSLGSLSVNPTDGSCWVVASQGQIVHLSAAGTELWRSPATSLAPGSIIANPADGSLWVIDHTPNQLVHYSSAGTILSILTSEEFLSVDSIAVDAVDGSLWVTDSGVYDSYGDPATYAGTAVIHLSSEGTELWRSARGAYLQASGIVLNAADRSCWVVDHPRCQVVRLKVGTPTVMVASAGSDVLVAPDGQTTLHGSATGGTPPYTYAWSPMAGLDDPSSAEPTASPASTTTYVLTVMDSLGQRSVASVKVTVIAFSDVSTSTWGYEQIMACAEAGVVQGYQDGRYQPLIPVTRDQMAVYIARALYGGEANVPTSSSVASFPDVPTDFWAFKHVECISNAGITQGYEDGQYHPEYPVTRDQMAVFMARSIVTPTGDANVPSPAPGTQTFPDVAPEFWAYKYIEYCQAQGVVQGYPDGKYEPGNVVTRDQMAVFVARAFQLTM